MTETHTLRCDHVVAQAPAAVWRALTDPDLVARWWAPGDVRPVVGHRSTMEMGPWGPKPCEVVAVDPGRLLAYTFAGGTLDTTITWRLVPDGTGTRVFLEQDGFDLDSPIGRQAYNGMGAGWPEVPGRIDGALEAAGVAGGGNR